MPSRQHSKKKRLDTSRLYSLEVCAFCGTNDDDEVLYGMFYSSKTISLHHNCMFFASGLSQGGKANTGILGFLLPDIEKELIRGKQLFCSYCRKRGATVGCVEIKCKKSFHLPCGIKNGSLHQFFSAFQSFCKYHMPKQTPLQINEDELYCHICYSALTQEELCNCLYSPCCQKNWFHKYCLQQYALSAGMYFFKCPLCNNTAKFRKEMKIHGIYIPNKDASWELEENAYQDLLIRPECDAIVCTCAKGRNHDSKKADEWKLLSCSLCGSHARHIACENLGVDETSWKCSECVTMEEEMSRRKINSCEERLNEKVETRKVENQSKESASSCVVGSSFTDSDNSWEKKLQDLANKITSLYSLLETYICGNRHSEEVYRERARKCKTLKKPQHVRRIPKEFTLASKGKRKEISEKCFELLKWFKTSYGNELKGNLKYDNPDLENHINDIALYISEVQRNFNQHLLKKRKFYEVSDDSEEEIQSSCSSTKRYADCLSLKQNNPNLFQQLEQILKFTENSGGNSVIKNTNQDKNITAHSSHVLCDSETLINDFNKELRVQIVKLDSYSIMQDNQEKIIECNNDTTGFISHLKSEYLLGHEKDNNFLQKNHSFLNKRTKQHVNCKKESDMQRKSVEVNVTTKVCSTFCFSSNDSKNININSSPSCSGFIKQPTARKTCSAKRSVHVVHKLNNCKKPKNSDQIYSPHCSEYSAAHINTLDSFLTGKSKDSQLCMSHVSSESHLVDIKPDIAIKVEEKQPVSLILRRQNPQNVKHIQTRRTNKGRKLCAHNQCIKRMLGHDCCNFRL